MKSRRPQILSNISCKLLSVNPFVDIGLFLDSFFESEFLLLHHKHMNK